MAQPYSLKMTELYAGSWFETVTHGNTVLLSSKQLLQQWEEQEEFREEKMHDW